MAPPPTLEARHQEPYASLDDAIERLIPYHVLFDEENDALDVRDALGLDLPHTAPAPLLCPGPFLIDTLIQEQALHAAERIHDYRRRFTAVADTVPRTTRTRTTADNENAAASASAAPEDLVKLEREQIAAARTLMSSDLERWNSELAASQIKQEAVLLAKQQQAQQATTGTAGTAGTTGQTANLPPPPPGYMYLVVPAQNGQGSTTHCVTVEQYQQYQAQLQARQEQYQAYMEQRQRQQQQQEQQKQ